MPVVIQKGPPKPLPVIKLSPKEIRDLLLSLPDNERKFIVTDPLPGEKKVYSLAKDGATGRIAVSSKDEVET